MIRPLVVDPSLLRFELPVMLAFTVALVPMILHRSTLGRRKGGLLVGGYGFFIAALVFR
jgi:cation:H+ antiporter